MALRNGEAVPNAYDPNPSHRCDADLFDEAALEGSGGPYSLLYIEGKLL